jgi:hypothetical protein
VASSASVASTRDRLLGLAITLELLERAFDSTLLCLNR